MTSTNAENKPAVEVHPAAALTGAKLLPLISLTKRPATPHGFKDAVEQAEFRKPVEENYGLALDGLLAVDFDSLDFSNAPDMAELYRLCKESGTWHQRTGGTNRGEQFLFRTNERLPNAAKIRSGSSEIFGDFKSGEGYIVGPNSIVVADKGPFYDTAATYEMLNEAVPVDVPDELVKRVWDVKSAKFTLKDFTPQGIDSVARGEHRNAILRHILSMRRHDGYSVDLTVKLAKDIIAGGNLLEGYDELHPFTDAELRKMAEGVEAGAPAELPKNIGAAFVPALSLNFEDEHREVFVDGMVWRGELHVFFGLGGIGKTGVACKLLADITQRGYDVAIIVSEDRPQDLVKRIIASGGDSSKVHVYDTSAYGHLTISEAKDDLRAFLESARLGCLYFDSVMDHRDVKQKVNAADDARGWAGPLGELAAATNTAVICTAHVNAQNQLEGAQQIRNKARSVVRMRQMNPGDKFTTTSGEAIVIAEGQLAVEATTEKANRGRTGSQVVFLGSEMLSVNPVTGVADSETKEDGTIGPRMLPVIERLERPKHVVAGTTPGTWPKEPKSVIEMRKRRSAIAEYMREDPGPHSNADLIATGLVTRNTFSSTMNHPMFKKTTSGLNRFYELAQPEDDLTAEAA